MSSLGTSNGAANKNVEVMALTSSGDAQRAAYEESLLNLEIQKLMSASNPTFLATVPTLPQDVKHALRHTYNQPIRLFGENLAMIRQRLMLIMARQHVLQERAPATTATVAATATRRADHEKSEVKYTTASAELIRARQQIAQFSLQRAARRLQRERGLARCEHEEMNENQDINVEDDQDNMLKRKSQNDEEITYSKLYQQINQRCVSLYQSLKGIGLTGSQYSGDDRAVSGLVTINNIRVADNEAMVLDDSAVNGNANNEVHATEQEMSSLIVTCSWTGTLSVWHGGSSSNANSIAPLTNVGRKTLCHEDRIMGITSIPTSPSASPAQEESVALLATASLDRTGKLFQLRHNPTSSALESTWELTEAGCLQGHEGRLCRVAFHPMAQHVGTTSFDHTWRLWDSATNQCILLQDGHAAPCYGIGFHPDGSLVATSDFGGVVQLWDLRTGKSIHHLVGQHALRVLQCEFSTSSGSPQLATAGDDGTIKIWDLRQRQLHTSIPAHSNLITRLRYSEGKDDGGEYLLSSSFDGTAKIWSTRGEYPMLSSLRGGHGHDGKVSGIDIVASETSTAPAIVTCGFDKTIKLWR
jgi:U4/U6 small nuclear ribonucleoprotein PRP4